MRFLLLVLTLSACATRRDLGQTPPMRESFTGYNRYGEARACYAMKDKTCKKAELTTEAENFKKACQEGGGESFPCDCASFLCSKNVWRDKN
ncbi:MAG: hypothetical protein HYW48_09635 [Deltaproteobacteria bacterium]|nr:hypothetical protein [Deltaproteobacteria bacterium]